MNPKVTPLVKESFTETVEPEKRGCLFSHEMDRVRFRDFITERITAISANGSGFERWSQDKNFTKSPHVLDTYSQSGCYFECMSEGTQHHLAPVDAEPCFPWNYPIIPFVAHPGCKLQ